MSAQILGNILKFFAIFAYAFSIYMIVNGLFISHNDYNTAIGVGLIILNNIEFGLATVVSAYADDDETEE